jgi:dipeptidase D
MSELQFSTPSPASLVTQVSPFPAAPKELWKHFEKLTTLPRPSKHEDAVREWIVAQAQARKAPYFIDDVGNILVKVSGSAGRENEAPILIQNHMDMVVDAEPGFKIDFKKDPIQVTRDGDWLKAKGTTLGADNGIGCAAALALLTEEGLTHPPLELLFTVDEETGLKGALNVETTHIQSRRLLNLDTEEWGSFYIGCAGGIDYELTQSYAQEKVSSEDVFFEMKLSGFFGGHSGLDIDRQRGNAIKALAECLDFLKSKPLKIAEFRGGKAHNIIPRYASVVFCLPRSSTEASILNNHFFETLFARWKSFLPSEDHHFSFECRQLTPEENPREVFSTHDSQKMIGLLLALPHGAHKFDQVTGGELVSLSNNLAIVYFLKGHFYAQLSLRFFDRGECVALENQVQKIAELAQIQWTAKSEYPSWKPQPQTTLLSQLTSLYEQLYAQKPRVTAIHAGLECGILRDRIGPIEAVSFGPTITGAHSPDERVHIQSVEKFWSFLLNVLKSI